jgi:hypothetical protein
MAYINNPYDFVLILMPMEFIQRFFLYMTLTAILCLVIGLFQPWMMLWWEDVQNRTKVIKVYGSVALISYAVYWGLFLV